jgi:hypothetical protein
MKIYGLSVDQLGEIAKQLDLRMSNVRPRKNAVEFKLDPPYSSHRYARETADGRKLKACSYEAFRDFITLAFRSGATRAQSAQGSWHSFAAFEDDLDRLARVNIGSRACPRYMGDASNEAVEPV